MPTKTVLAALSATALATSALPAFSQASGDGFQGPRVFQDTALDQSLAAMNRERVITERRTELLAGVVSPTARDFTTLSVAVRDVPEPDLDGPADIVAFDTEVTGDGGLEAAIASINSTIMDRDNQLFIEVARAASGVIEDSFDEAPDTITAFGPQIAGDATLDAKMVHVFDLVEPEAASLEEIVPVFAFSDASLDQIASAWSAPRIDL